MSLGRPERRNCAFHAIYAIVAIKIGRSDAGARASASHTASLSGSYTAYRAVFERYGVIEAEDPDEAVAITGLPLSTLHDTGCRTLWLASAGHSALPFADTITLPGDDPAVAITAIANAACAALTADIAQQTRG